MIKKQGTTIIICVIAFIVLLASYFIFIKPLLKTESKESEPPTLLEGEMLGPLNRILLFEHTEKKFIKSIEVHNEHGSYTFYRGFNGDENNFYIKGMEGAPYSLELLSSLVVSSGYTLSMTRLEDMNEDLSVYGLSEKDSPAWYVLTSTDGASHKVFIGNLIPTGGGYYCMYDGRKAVYVLDTTLSQTLLADVSTFINPILAYPVAQKDIMKVDDLMIIRDGERFVYVDTLSPEENGRDDGMISYEVKYPEGMILNTGMYSGIVEKLANLVGTQTVICGSELNKLDVEMMKEKYDIDIKDPYYFLHYKVDNIESDTVFSKPDENGDMFAYSSIFNLVAKINVSSVPFIGYDILKFVDSSIFAENINDVSKIEVKGSLKDGPSVDTFFTLDGEKEAIIIKQKGSDKAYDADSVKNFRQLYKTILSIRLEDYAKEKDIEKLTLLAELKVTLDSGKELLYKFYPYSTRQCYYTVNGKGEYCTTRDSVEKLLLDTDRMIKGLPIDSDNIN